MKEDPFVKTALAAAREVLGPPLHIESGKALLYEIKVNGRLQINVDPKSPVRGDSAFQTDLCIFEEVEKDVHVPRVVLEFKKTLTTHDILVYSTKARKHKQIYPYLRYGLVIGDEKKVPGKYFTHNEGLDFCVAVAFLKEHRLHEVIAKLLKVEVQASRQLERFTSGAATTYLFRNDVSLDEGSGKVV